MPTKIHVQNVRKGFDNDRVRLQVIEGLDFEVRDGEFVAIVGPSGCGKTTLMNIMAGFLAPDSGAILVDGAPRTTEMHGRPEEAQFDGVSGLCSKLRVTSGETVKKPSATNWL
jgi:ABC-type sugar transport system ATPase subunit